MKSPFENNWDEEKKNRHTCTLCGYQTKISPKHDFKICYFCGNRIYTKKGLFKKNLSKEGVKWKIKK